MKTKILTQEDFDKELAKVIYSHPAVMTDDLLEEISDRIAQLFALGYHNNLKINVIADKNGFCVATFGGLASILTLVYPGKLTCKRFHCVVCWRLSWTILRSRRSMALTLVPMEMMTMRLVLSLFRRKNCCER